MTALTSDFNVFAARIAARLSAVFFSISHIAKAWYVRAFLRLLIRHSIPPFRVPITKSLRQFSATTSSLVNACSSPNLGSSLRRAFPRLFGQLAKGAGCPECPEADIAVDMWTVSPQRAWRQPRYHEDSGGNWQMLRKFMRDRVKLQRALTTLMTIEGA
jgi:hypothetical protein